MTMLACEWVQAIDLTTGNGLKLWYGSPRETAGLADARQAGERATEGGSLDL